MGFEVYDYREDVRNVLVTTQLRSRFMRMEAGFVAEPHSHDLGHEVFLVLEGRAEFDIDGEKEVLGPGQMCVALVDQVDQLHGIRVLDDAPMTMYLSVTPHIQPTHTMWSDGQRLPHRFAPPSAYDEEVDATPVADLLSRFLEEVNTVAAAAQSARRTQTEMAGKLEAAVEDGDLDSASAVRSDMWDALFPLFQDTAELALAWNVLAGKAAPLSRVRRRRRQEPLPGVGRAGRHLADYRHRQGVHIRRAGA